MISNAQKTVLVVDDEPVNLSILNNTLKADYRLLFAKSGAEALRLAANENPDLILLDIMMPEMTGKEVCTELKSNSATQNIPVIFVTALSDEDDEEEGLSLGAVDYIAKPISPAVVKARVKTHLSLVQAEELKKTRLQVIQTLGRASEYKDNETGLHVIRMSHYSYILAKAYGLSEQQSEEILHAAPMHDLGKIGIPDSIMLKPGKLTTEEFEIIKTHPEIGAEILGDDESSLIRLAKSVALTHHEKWDGSGYPKGLAGEDIPLEGRIVALADVFDALTSKRPYKEAWSVDEAMDFITEQSGKHFQPELVNLMKENLDKVLEVKEKWKEE